MTTAEKEFLSKTVIDAIGRLERRRSLAGAAPAHETRCIFCGEPIHSGEFYLLRDGEGYIAGCLNCGGPRESYPSVNPFMFSNFVRRRMN